MEFKIGDKVLFKREKQSGIIKSKAKPYSADIMCNMDLGSKNQ